MRPRSSLLPHYIITFGIVVALLHEVGVHLSSSDSDAAPHSAPPLTPLLPSTHAAANIPTHYHDRQLIVSNACRHVIVPLDPSCPRHLVVRYLQSAGFGHQFSELLFGMYAAQYLGLTFTWSPISASGDHGDNYTSLVQVLGLERFFVRGLGLARAEDLRELRVRNNSRFGHWSEANALDKRFAHMPCNNSVLSIEGWWHCVGVQDNNCFWAPEQEFLFQRYSACLRAGVRAFGRAFDTCVLFEENASSNLLRRDELVVVWHLRFGDVAPHKPGDEFFQRVVAALGEITRGYIKRVRILLVGGGKGLLNVPAEYVESLRNTINVAKVDDAGRDASPIFRVHRFHSDAFERQFLAMMQADVLIGSGSSVPQVAALLSGGPLFFNHAPKHWYGVGLEATADTVDMDEKGQALDSLRRVRLMLYERVAERRKGEVFASPCRENRGWI